MAKTKLIQFTIYLLMISTFAQIEGVADSRNLDEVSPDLDNKCGGCPCNNPCNPPPSPPPPSPPPPKPKPTPSSNCPPPPSGGGQYPPNPPYIYVNGPPGNLYPIDHYYSCSGQNLVGFFPFVIASGLWLLA